MNNAIDSNSSQKILWDEIVKTRSPSKVWLESEDDDDALNTEDSLVAPRSSSSTEEPMLLSEEEGKVACSEIQSDNLLNQ